MLNMNDFEGIKKFENVNNYTVDFLYEIISKYEKEIGKTYLNDDEKIIADVDGKYLIEIYLMNKYIVIKREIETGFSNENIALGTDLKSIDMSKADRMVEQIYDLINTITDEGKVVEPITSAKKVLFVKQEEGIIKNNFITTNDSNEVVYKINGNKILKEFEIHNVETRRRNLIIKYSQKDQGVYFIVKNAYTTIKMEKQTQEVKTVFLSKIDGKKLLLKADYSDNHYIIEVNNIVVGAIDSLDSENKDSYRLEINDLAYEDIIIALTLIIDVETTNV